MRELTVRSPIVGITLDTKVRPDIGNGGPRERRVILLIHGYQNPPDKARNAYRTFESSLRFALGIRNPERLGSLWGFLWPGDHRHLLVSVATYSGRVPDALTSGALLAEYISGMRSDQRILLVAHSLGCRVALETVRRLAEPMKQKNYTGARIEAAFLFAAAVPTRDCESYFKRTADCKEYVFYSARDRALGSTFALGEYFHSGHRATAVGRTGGPSEQRWSGRQHTSLDHGRYWSSDMVARRVVRLLGAAPALPAVGHELIEVEDVEWREVAAVPARWPNERHLGWRALGGAIA